MWEFLSTLEPEGYFVGKCLACGQDVWNDQEQVNLNMSLYHQVCVEIWEIEPDHPSGEENYYGA